MDFEQGSITLAPGDALVLYTDGVTEAMNGEHEELGMERLQEILAATSSRSPEEINRSIFNGIRAFAGGAPQSDDITCLTLFRGPAA